MLAHILTNNGLTAMACGKNYTVNSTHPNWTKILKAVEAGDERLVAKLMDIPASISKWFREGNVVVKNGEVYMGTEKIGGPIVDKILSFIENGYPVAAMLKFLNNLMNNPSKTSVQELYSFLEHKNLPITDNGNFLAYKGLQSDYYSITAGKLTLLKGIANNGRIFNGVGEEIECVRNQVDDNRTHHCSTGIHAGSLEYATNFAGGGKVVIVEINPADVVSVPEDCNCQKLRTCRYKVIADYTGPLPESYFGTERDEEWDTEEDEWDCDTDCDLDDEESETEDESRYDVGYDAGWNRAVNFEHNYVEKIPSHKRNDWEQGFMDGYADASDCSY